MTLAKTHQTVSKIILSVLKSRKTETFLFDRDLSHSSAV